MTELELYNSDLIPGPFGLINTGVICYFNSLLQGLFSCSSFINRTKGLPISKLLTNPETNRSILNSVIAKNPTFGHGQEDSSEALLLLLDQYPKSVTEIFEHRFRLKSKCTKCELVTESVDESNLLIVNPDIDLVKYLNCETKTEVEKKCKCGNNKSIQIRNYVMTPEILVVLLKKYDKKSKTYMPLEFKVANHKYILVSQTEHSGTQSGGHYYSISRRKGGIFTLNDSSVTKSDFVLSDNTYLLWYHLHSLHSHE